MCSSKLRRFLLGEVIFSSGKDENKANGPFQRHYLFQEMITLQIYFMDPSTN